MSHIVTIKTEVRDPAAVAAACRRLGLPEPVAGHRRAVRRPGHRPARPAARLDLPGRRRHDAGTVATTTTRGPGAARRAGPLLQAYAVEKAQARGPQGRPRRHRAAPGRRVASS